MQAWAASVAVRLRGLGFDVGASDDSPSSNLDQTAAGSADLSSPRSVALSTLVLLAPSERSGGRSRANISLSIDEDHVEVAVDVPPADVRAARARIVDPVRALELSTALEALPEQFAVGVAGDDERSPASRASTDQIRALLDRAEREQRSLWLGWSIARDVAVAHAALLDEQLEDAVVALGSVFTMLAAAPEGPGAPDGHPRRSTQRDRPDRPRADDERRGAKRRARESDDGMAPARQGRGQRLEQRQRDGEIEAERDSPERDGPAPRLQRSPGAKAQAPAGPGARPGRTGRPAPDGMPAVSRQRGKHLADAHRSIEKGSRVRVLEGPFSGKVGIVQELESKGAVRVMLGLLAVRVDVRDLARCAEGRNRPVLSTSHRKPVPVRS